MKKDAFFYGIVLAFVAFVLMIASLLFEAWRSKEVTRLAGTIADEEEAEVKGEVFDLSGLETIQTADGAMMVKVPEGPFLMGNPPVAGDPDEIPQRTLYLSAFYIDLHEVTHEQYGASPDRPPSGRPDLLEGCRPLLHLGRQAAADRGGMGKGRPR